MIIARRCVYCLFPVNPVGDGLMLLLLARPGAKSYFLHKSQGVVAQMQRSSIEAAIGITKPSWDWFGLEVWSRFQGNFFVLVSRRPLTAGSNTALPCSSALVVV